MKKISLALLLIMFLILCCCEQHTVSSISSQKNPPMYIQNLNVYPETMEGLFDDSFPENLSEKEVEEILGQLIYQYNNMIDVPKIATEQKVPFVDAMYYLSFYGGFHYYGKELTYDVRTQLTDYFDNYRYFKISAKEVEEYLSSIFNTKIDRSILSDPTKAENWRELFGFIEDEKCYLVRFRPSSFDTDVKIHSIQKGKNDVYTIHVDYMYVGDGTEPAELIYEQIFKIKLNHKGYRFISTEYLYSCHDNVKQAG